MIKIISLLENVSNFDNLKSEHGLSLYIEKDNLKCLMDTGGSDKFLENAKELGIDLTDLSWVIITHNHIDHIGGLESLLEYNKNVNVIIKNDAKGAFHFKKLFINKYIGIDRNIFEKHKDRILFFTKDCKISDNFYLRSDSIKNPYFVCKDKSLMERKKGKLVPDEFNHELFLTIEDGNRVIIISACSHSGIVNIVNTTQLLYPNKEISHVVGGFHMMGYGIKQLNCDKEYIHEVVEILDKSCTEKILTCHCTGKKAYKIMKEQLGDKISYLSTGESIIIN
ncbi:MBL fold metallo-hydrolase [Metaclostridioides mangenotii]|uniref:MBL fold metallo-hydrolase n=1 Tax=Metaclostridioides mangenotii TaxID=1540 RepID=UPI0028E7C8AB|nr:MBL fold metallo-hydrolase [Clostridioides mangenotii]